LLLYIHIPFCDSKCYYCSFNSYVDKYHLKEKYVEKLCEELEFELKNNQKHLKSIFIGGGTPSSIKAQFYEEIFNLLKDYITNTTEITIEANPNSATKEWLEKLYILGANRVSFGVQSFNNDKLRFLGRNHNKNSAISAIQNAICIGFNSVNCDIIYGISIDSKELIEEDLRVAAALGVHHISSYQLTLEEGTKFWNMQEVCVENEELARFVIDMLKTLGYTQYEISNFAKNNNYKSIHNRGYWEYKEYLGVGCGAVGRVGNQRYYKPKIIEEYLKNPLFKEFEELSKEDIQIEKILLGLRCEVGFDIDLIVDSNRAKLDLLQEQKKIYIANNRVYNQDYLLSDEIALYLIR
jgi:oxygen-independent coproporphyrinogen-3 oxidase